MRLAPLQHLVKQDARRTPLLTQAIEDTRKDLYDFVMVTPEDTAAIARRCKEARNKFHRWVCGPCGRCDCRDSNYRVVRLKDVGYANDADKAATFKWLRLTSNDDARGVYGNVPSRKAPTTAAGNAPADTTGAVQDASDSDSVASRGAQRPLDSAADAEDAAWRDKYDSRSLHEERKERTFDVVYRTADGHFAAATTNAAAFYNVYDAGGDNGLMHLVPEAVTTDAAGDLGFYACSTCAFHKKKPHDAPPGHSIAGGLDYGRLNIVAQDKDTGADVAITIDKPSDMEALMTATQRQYQVIAKLVVRQHGARSQLHGHAIFSSSTPNPMATASRNPLAKRSSPWP